MNKRFAPLLSVVLFAMWLLLNNTLSIGQMLLAAVLSVGLVWAARPMRPLQPRVRRLHVAVRLLLAVLRDVVRSNIGVARIILRLTGAREVKSGFMAVPLDLRDPHGLAALAMILTATPGTVWVDLSPDRSVLTLHVLDLQDEAVWIRLIKERYERPLMEIFQ